MKILLFVFLLCSIEALALQFDMSEIPKECFVECPVQEIQKSPFRRLWISEELKLAMNEEPNYEAILSGAERHKANVPYVVMDQNNPCDQIGTLYTAKYMAYFWPNTSAYKALDKRERGGIDVLFQIAEKGTYNPEGAELIHTVLPQAKCIAKLLIARKN